MQFRYHTKLKVRRIAGLSGFGRGSWGVSNEYAQIDPRRTDATARPIGLG